MEDVSVTINDFLKARVVLSVQRQNIKGTHWCSFQKCMTALNCRNEISRNNSPIKPVLNVCFRKTSTKTTTFRSSKGKPIKSNLYLYASYSKYKYMYLNASVSNKSKNNSSNWILVCCVYRCKSEIKWYRFACNNFLIKI